MRRNRTALVAVGVVAGLLAAVTSTGSRPASAAISSHQLPPPANPAAPARIIIPTRNLPDPFVLHVGTRYLMYSSQTSFSTPPAALTQSLDDTTYHWGKTGAALSSVPVWAESGFTWSPDVREVSPSHYVMYFSAWALKSLYFDPAASGFSQRYQCLGIATSSNAAGPFTPVGKTPFLCQAKDHHGDIDPRTFLAPNGQLWLDWKSDDNAFETPHVTHLWAQRLTPDGLHVEGPRTIILSGAHQGWNGGLIEAPDMVYAAGKYWLVFSGSWFNGPNYAIGLTTCTGPAGPCQLSPHPWVSSNSQGSSPGEESLFHNGKGWWMVYSPWGMLGHTYRPVALARVVFVASGPYLAKF